MDYEKLYKEALNRARGFYETKSPDCLILESIFPELAESEDERIRKELIRYLPYCDDISKDTKERWITWLEKQCEQKPPDKVGPKFKVGEWVVFIKTGSTYQVEKIENYEYTLRHIFGGSVCLSFSNEELIREWTIQDTNDGDVLVYPDGSITLFRKMVENLYMAHILLVDGHIELNNSCAVFNATPATKEQRDFLFQKMKEAGYKWNAKKKKLI